MADLSIGPGAVMYLWVIRKMPGRWLVNNWDDIPVWLPMAGLDARPDVTADGLPVIRRVGTGDIAEYYRFERCRLH